MNNSPFRSPDVWKSALLILPDSSYFELMRSVFGNIKTPFNKQRLAEDLEAFLSRKEIQEAIALYIDETDARIIAAIATLEEPAPGELETFFAGEFSYAELHSILLNLEERLILYRFQEKGVYHLALNPLLEPVLGPIVVDKSSLFPSEPLEISELSNPPGYGVLDDRILAALFAFVSDQQDFFKTEGGIRKKILDDGRLLFPGLDLESLIGGLQCLGLLQQQGEGLVPDESKIRYFTALSFNERQEYCAAGICIDKTIPKPALWPLAAKFPLQANRGRLSALTRFIHTFMDALKMAQRYPRSTLKRIADILERSGIEQIPWGVETKGRGNSDDLFDSMLEAFKTVGLLGTDSRDGYFRYPPTARETALQVARETALQVARETALQVAPETSSQVAVIAMDTAFSCILYPEIPFSDALALASFSLVRETGTAVRFEITRESVVRGFDRGMNAEAMVTLLDRLSGNQVDQNLRWTVKDWESRYSGVSLHQGIVLTLSEDRRYLAEAEPVSSLISRTLMPGVYLLSASEKTDAIQALHKAGIDIIAQPPQLVDTLPGDRYSPYPSQPESRFHSDGFQDKPAFCSEVETLFLDTEKAEQAKGRFRSALEKLSLTKGERDELSARIERRLILNESQLVGVSVRYEKLEARGLDYVGKTSIAKQAITSKQLIEIMWSNPDGEVNRVIGIPEAMEKSGGESLLVLKPVPPGDTIRLPLGKISLLRRIKQSIFGE
ncbi:helicase-associated domain-containing protein [Treponema primitia]|uniref:helicase-associated domain-containing protein n=1 Tax=Treponema primitia TaxID=88058 RepID=UPI0002555397|nr:helicase-associated domain-containing protein [Treponema primitia]